MECKKIISHYSDQISFSPLMETLYKTITLNMTYLIYFKERKKHQPHNYFFSIKEIKDHLTPTWGCMSKGGGGSYGTWPCGVNRTNGS